MSWIIPKTNWFGRRNSAGVYSGDYFETTDAERIKNNALILLDMFGERFPNAAVLMDYYPNGDHRMIFDSVSDHDFLQTWQISKEGYFDFHMLERIAVAVRNMMHCNEGIWNVRMREIVFYSQKDNDYYELETEVTDPLVDTYMIRNYKKPDAYLPGIRSIIGSDGLWVDKYYQENFFNYRELNSLEEGMCDLYTTMGYKKQDKYRMFQWNFGIRKGM